MEDWIKWGVGLAFAALTAVVGYMANAHKTLAAKQSEDVKGLHAKIDDVKEKYVRRDDFAEFRKDTKEDFEGINAKLDRLLSQTKH